MPTPYRLSLLRDNINTEIPDNVDQLVSAEDIRVNLIECIESMVDIIGDTGRSYASTIDQDGSTVGALKLTGNQLIEDGNLIIGAGSGGHLNLGPGTSAVAPVVLSSGTNTATAKPGAIEYDGSSFYATVNGPSRNALVLGDRAIATTSPLTGGGSLSSNLTIAIPAATSGANGYLASGDWTTFNNKADADIVSNLTTGDAGGVLFVDSDGSGVSASDDFRYNYSGTGVLDFGYAAWGVPSGRVNFRQASADTLPLFVLQGDEESSENLLEIKDFGDNITFAISSYIYGSSNVQIGQKPSGASTDTLLNIFGNGSVFKIESASPLATGAGMTFVHNSASPASGDVTGYINFDAENASGTQVTYNQIKSAINTTASGAEAGELIFSSRKSGTLTESFRINNSGALQLAAGTTTRPPLKLTSGTNLTSPQAGSIEFDGTKLYCTQTSGPTRQAVVYETRTISTTAPLTGSGDLSSNLTLAMPVATSGANGYLASGDWTTFNNKVPTSRTISTTSPLYGSGNLGSNITLGMAQATNLVSGFLASGDWTTFNNKLSSTATGSSGQFIYNSGGSYAGAANLTYSSGKVGIGGTGTPVSQVHVFTSTASDGLTVENTNAGATGVLLSLYHNSGSPSVNDVIGLINFDANDDNVDRVTSYAQIKAILNAYTEDDGYGELVFNAMKAGTLTESFRINSFGSLALTAGTTTKAPLVFASGTNTVTPQAGGVEFDGSKLYFTTSGLTRKTVVDESRSIDTTAPLTGSGNLSGDLTIAIPAADTSTDGYLTSTDWNTFNNMTYAPANSTHWNGDPTTVAEALDRMAYEIYTLKTGVSIDP